MSVIIIDELSSPSKNLFFQVTFFKATADAALKKINRLREKGILKPMTDFIHNKNTITFMAESAQKLPKTI